MKKYVYLLIMAFLAIQFQSCSSGDEDTAGTNLSDMMLDIIGKTTRNQVNEQIKGGGHNNAPVEGEMFYEENIPEVVMVTALGTFALMNQKEQVEMYENLGGSVQTKNGGSFLVTNKGKSMHIEGSGVTYPQSGFTYHTTLSLTIDDASLIATGAATITNFTLSLNTNISYHGESATATAYLAASNIPMVSNAIIYTHWKGSGITDYSWASGDDRLTLVANPANFIEIWITFKDGSTAKARILG